jgi:hypothetical protein
MTASLTPQQISLLRRIGDGHGLPAYVMRPRNCAPDVELLCLIRFLALRGGQLSITSEGAAWLREYDTTSREEHVTGLRVAHGLDHSIGVEYWPQAY